MDFISNTQCMIEIFVKNIEFRTGILVKNLILIFFASDFIQKIHFNQII
jgi:hypothetical protein